MSELSIDDALQNQTSARATYYDEDAAGVFEVPGESLTVPARFGNISVSLDRNGFTVKDSQGCDCLVKHENLRGGLEDLDNESLKKILGDLYFSVHEVVGHDNEGNIVVRTVHSQSTRGRIDVSQNDHGDYILRLKFRGLGGGPFSGIFAACLVKAIGYAVVGATCGPVGWGMIAADIGGTIVTGGVGIGINRVAQGTTLVKAGADIAVATNNANKAVKAAEQAAKAAKQCASAKNLKAAHDLMVAANEAQAALKKAQAAKAAFMGANVANELNKVNGKVQNGKTAIDAAKVGAGAAFPPTAIVSIAGDLVGWAFDSMPFLP